MERAERRKIQDESSERLFSFTTTYSQGCSIFIPEHVLATCLYMGINKNYIIGTCVTEIRVT